MTVLPHSSRRALIAVLAASLGALALPGAVPAAHAATAQSPAGEIAVVTVNAHQRTLDDLRMGELASALGSRVGTSPVAPDVVVVEEITQTGLVSLRDKLGAATGSTYAGVGLTSNTGLTSDVKVKLLLNTSTMDYTGRTTWLDVCDANRLYQLITAREKASGREVAVAGVHFAPVPDTTSGSDTCRTANAAELRKQLASYDDRGTVVGDFNKRPTVLEYECDPDERAAPESWYAEMTATRNGHAYVDTVRASRRALGLGMEDMWTFEAATATTTCTGAQAVRRYRLDYIFASDTVRTVAASADNPGWGGPTPGTVGCTPAPQCKYSDHRFVWAQLALPEVTAHVHDLDATRSTSKKTWRATVTAEVRSGTEQPVAGVTVAGRWSTGESGSCTTGTGGTCAMSTSSPRSTSGVSLTVTGLSAPGTTYTGPNHDADGDSDGTTVTVLRP